MSPAITLVKYLLFFFNFIFWVSGIAIAIIGIVYRVELVKYGSVLDDSIAFTAGCIILIVVGCVITQIAFFGCCGAIRESYCMIMTFIVLLVIIFLLEIAGGIASYVCHGQIDQFALKQFNNSWGAYSPGTQMSRMIDGIQKDLDILQTFSKLRWTHFGELLLSAGGTTCSQWNGCPEIGESKFHCCGVTNYTDWAYYEWGHKAGNFVSVPYSCCVNITDGCGVNAFANPWNIYQEGCYVDLKNSFEHNIVIVAGVGIGVAFVQLIGIVLAQCLANSVKNNAAVEDIPEEE